MDMRSLVMENPILAIMRNIPLDRTIDYGEMTVRGGVRFFEVALNSKDGLKQIEMLREHFGETCLIGAGTAVTIEKAEQALSAGAQFLLTPGSTEEVLEFCAGRNIPLLPGVMTPCDVAVCRKYGFKTMKLFPAGSMPKGYVKALKGPFDDTDYMAIGGVDRGNIREFLKEGYIGAGLSGKLVPKEILETCDWEAGSACIRTMFHEVLKFREENKDED